MSVKTTSSPTSKLSDSPLRNLYSALKPRLKKALRALKAVRTWQYAIILIPLLFLAATLLRFDHLKMVELRAAVIAADAEEDDEKLASALTDLQTFVFKHIVINITEQNGNQSLVFGTGPFYLEHQYLRAANAAIAAAESQLASDANPNGNIYEAVRQICQPQAIANGWAWSSQPYLDCWTTELAKYPATDNLPSPSAAVPSTELYRHNYASPIWAPTFTGFVLLICLILALIVIIRFLSWFFLSLALLFTK